MNTDDLAKKLEALRDDAQDEKMSSIVAEQKLIEAFAYADELIAEMKDPEIKRAKYSFIEMMKGNTYNNDNLRLLCAIILQGWSNDINNQISIIGNYNH